MSSTDDGTSWQPAQAEPARFTPITALRFEDATHGLAVGHEGLVLRARDDGSTWEPVRIPGPEVEELHLNRQITGAVSDARPGSAPRSGEPEQVHGPGERHQQVADPEREASRPSHANR